MVMTIRVHCTPFVVVVRAIELELINERKNGHNATTIRRQDVDTITIIHNVLLPTMCGANTNYQNEAFQLSQS